MAKRVPIVPIEGEQDLEMTDSNDPAPNPNPDDGPVVGLSGHPLVLDDPTWGVLG